MKTKYRFSEIISDSAIRERWEKVRKYFFLRESTYDMTNRCNINCEGCYYFKGDKQFAVESGDVQAWQKLMQAEKARGITYVVLAGAEPALVTNLCEVCHEIIPLGTIATNGLKLIPPTIQYKIHISVWGNDETSLKVRKAQNMLVRQIENYKDDPRSVFVYTFTRDNIAQADEVAALLAGNGCRFTFNMFSAPVGYTGDLCHTPSSLKATREKMLALLSQYPQHLLYSPYNAVAHTHHLGLHDLFSCSYPRCNPSTNVGLGRSFKQYRTDLTWDRDAACCVPDTDCDDCRHYAAGSAIVTARLFRHADDPEVFKAWLDYVDTYLAVWVTGYEKGANLGNPHTMPPESGPK